MQLSDCYPILRYRPYSCERQMAFPSLTSLQPPVSIALSPLESFVASARCGSFSRANSGIMILGRRSSSRSCRCHLSPLRPARQDPPLRWPRSGAVERRRHFASVVSNRLSATATEPSSTRPASPTVKSLLGNLLSAIRRKDAAATNKAFYAWTEALGDELSPQHPAVMREFGELSSPVLSEIIRSMDPINHPELDVAHGMTISLGETQFTDIGKLMDNHGVRVHHRKVFQGMLTILRLREGHRFALRPADFTVFLRCVGAAVDFRAAPIVFGSMGYHGLIPQRTTETWTEFLKARYIIEPTYYQFNRARVAIDPRSLVTHDDLIQGNAEMIQRMDRVRFSANVFMREPWNRRRDELEEDVRRQLRRPGGGEEQEHADYRSFWRHFVRQQCYPNDLTEELMCAGMIGFSRSSDKRSIFNLILKPYYGIVVDQENHTVKGGRYMGEGHPLYPTERLFFGLVEAFGAMSEISLGMQLIDFISQRYRVEISHEVWSNLLNWTFVCASKKYQHLRKLRGEGDQTHVSTADVVHVWDVMTSEPYNIKPSFQDLDIRIKTLLITHRMDEAVELIRNTAVPYYNTLVDDFEKAVMNEVLLKDATIDPAHANSTAISRAIHHRHRCEARKDHVHNRMAIWFDDLLRISSETKQLRNGPFASTTIPNLVQEFRPFFQSGIRYRTATGSVTFLGLHESESHRYVSDQVVERKALSAKYGSVAVPSGSRDEFGVLRMFFDEETGEHLDNPDFDWPTTDPMRIIERRREPRRRLDVLSKPPPFSAGYTKERREWWKQLELQLMM